VSGSGLTFAKGNMSMAEQIILFDGVCNLCNGLVRFIIRQDKAARFKFASLQSASGQQLLQKFELPARQLISFVYIRGDRCYLKSDAALEVLRDLGNGWKLFYAFKIFPKVFRDFMYNIVARSRYKIFGRTDSCPLPAPELSERFIA
jgi:predicted DCC family thiol-disulfide oxidoreductase YuxK